MTPNTTSASRPTLVFIHGVGLDASMWCGVMNQLSPSFSCITFTMPGHQGSAQKAADNIDGYIDALAAFVNTHTSGTVGLVGFSMGAMVAAGYAAKHPSRVSRLVLMNALHVRDEAARAAVLSRLEQTSVTGLEAIAGAAIARWFSDAFCQAHPEPVAEIRRVLVSNNMAEYLRAYRVFATSDAEIAGRLPAITCPVLALTGALDVNSTPAMSRAIADAVADGRHIVLSGLAHGAPIEAPECIADTLHRFFLEETADA